MQQLAIMSLSACSIILSDSLLLLACASRISLAYFDKLISTRFSDQSTHKAVTYLCSHFQSSLQRAAPQAVLAVCQQRQTSLFDLHRETHCHYQTPWLHTSNTAQTTTKKQMSEGVFVCNIWHHNLPHVVNYVPTGSILSFYGPWCQQVSCVYLKCRSVKEIAIKTAVSARCIIRKTQSLIRLNVRCDATDVFGNSTFYHINLT